MYCIQATITTTDGKWSTTKQVPTFYLDENVQGILSTEHAEQIARDILHAMEDGDTLSITAVRV